MLGAASLVAASRCPHATGASRKGLVLVLVSSVVASPASLLLIMILSVAGSPAPSRRGRCGDLSVED